MLALRADTQPATVLHVVRRDRHIGEDDRLVRRAGNRRSACGHPPDLLFPELAARLDVQQFLDAQGVAQSRIESPCAFIEREDIAAHLGHVFRDSRILDWLDSRSVAALAGTARLDADDEAPTVTRGTDRPELPFAILRRRSEDVARGSCRVAIEKRSS